MEKNGRRALAHLRNRPLTLVRSVGKSSFLHEGKLPAIPEAVHQPRLTKSDRSQGVRVWIDGIAGLLGLAEMDVVEIHPWQSTVEDIDEADLAVFELDPGAGVTWDFVCDTALALREELRAQGLAP